MSKKKNTTIPLSFFDKTENYLQKHDWTFFWIIFAIAALVSTLLYDPRVSLTGDDSAYVLYANNFINKFTFPAYQGPLYPIALSLIVLVFGVSLFPLKLFSLLSMLGFMYFTFVSFRKRMPFLLLFSVLLLVSINSFVLYYASQTYSEAFYMFMQSIFIYVFFRLFINNQSAETGFKQNIKAHLWLALVLLGVAVTRSVGFAAIIAVCAYFLFYKEWKNLGLAIGCFLGVFLLYSLLKNLIWDSNELQFANQGSGLLNKNFYRPEEGKEDFAGLLVRFWQNSLQYLSNGLFRIMGFHYEAGSNSVFRTLLVYGTAIAGLCFSYKKQKNIFFAILSAGIFLVVTFFALQAFWNQERLIIPVYPFILLSILACLYYVLSLPKLRSFQFLYLLPVIVLFTTGLRDTSGAVSEARKISNKYSGLTPDWVNYIKAGEWAAKNLNETDLVACRKPSISSIYAEGKSFHGIYSVPSGNPKAFMQKWLASPADYVAVPISETNFNYYSSLPRSNYHARMELGGEAFWILNTSNDLKVSLEQHNIQTFPLEQVERIGTQLGGNFGVFYADSLLAPFKERKVTHLMTASLRINPNAKTGQTISTVERYAYFIQEKYPNLFEFVYQEGHDNNEPARIFKINWDFVE